MGTSLFSVAAEDEAEAAVISFAALVDGAEHHKCVVRGGGGGGGHGWAAGSRLLHSWKIEPRGDPSGPGQQPTQEMMLPCERLWLQSCSKHGMIVPR